MKDLNITQYIDDKLKSTQDRIAEEGLLHLSINKEVSFDVVISPELIKEFVFGNLYSEGFIHSINEIQNYKETHKKGLINIDVKIKKFDSKKSYLKKNYNIVWTECGSSGELKRLSDQFTPLESTIEIKAQNILKIPHEIKNKIEAFKQTGAFHYAFLFNIEVSLVIHAYDIGRHNAVDKVIGTQFIKSKNLSDKLLYTTGRVSSDLILKCIRAKIPVIASRGAALTTAIDLANKYNVCLIGFLRGNRFNIYSHPETIIE